MFCWHLCQTKVVYVWIVIDTMTECALWVSVSHYCDKRLTKEEPDFVTKTVYVYDRWPSQAKHVYSRWLHSDTGLVEITQCAVRMGLMMRHIICSMGMHVTLYACMLSQLNSILLLVYGSYFSSRQMTDLLPVRYWKGELCLITIWHLARKEGGCLLCGLWPGVQRVHSNNVVSFFTPKKELCIADCSVSAPNEPDAQLLVLLNYSKVINQCPKS